MLFKRFINLELHLMHKMCDHTSITKFKCPNCSAEYSHKATLRRHLKKNVCDREFIKKCFIDSVFNFNVRCRHKKKSSQFAAIQS